jgi:tripartite-type tricarboxylate transporter receptor subunit TctC
MVTQKKSSILLVSFSLLLTYFFIQPAKVSFAEEKYPTKTIRYIVPVAAGSIQDVSARKIVSIAEKSLGQEIIVENKPGAGTLVGVTFMVKSKPDGYTLASVPTSIFNVHPFFSKMDFDPLTDITPIIQFVNFNQTLGVPIQSPIKTFEEFIAEAQKRQITIGGVGMTPAEIALLTLAAKTKINIKIVPFGGAAPTLLAAMGGQVDAFVCSATHQFARAGKVRIIARLNGEPKKGEIPTLRELGYDIEALTFAGISGPKGLPEHVQKKLEEVFTQAVHDPSVAEVIESFGDSLGFRNSKDYFKHCKEAYEQARNDLKELGLGIFSKDKK